MRKRRLHDGDGSALGIGARLRNYRVTARVTQESVASAAKLTPKFLSQIENGHVNPSIGVLTRLVEDGLHLPLAAFFADDGDDADSRETLVRLTTLLARQPPKVRRLALRIVEVLCASDAEDAKDGKDGKSRHR